MTSKEEGKQKILELTKNYLNNKNKFKNDKETDTRVKFIDRMFEALGWDVWGQRIPDEVQREESVKFKDKLKKVDYTLKINGIPQIMVEAKALGEDVERDDYVKQAIEYAYNKACSWAVLTNFKTTKIFYVDRDTWSPFYSIHIEDIDDFDRKFEDLWLLSRESVERSVLDIEVKRRGIKKDKIPIDQQLFSDLKRWRELLSKDIQKRYSDKYDSDTIDEMVQRIIDRIIFIRKAEDSELEERKLDQLTRRFNESTYKELKKIFLEYNEKYNSKLFGENKNSLHEVDNIEVGNEIIEEVIRSTYKPKGSRIEYNFAVIDADILGNIYEQYLAYILTKTPKKTKLEGGKTHRKEQGIYYTPSYIVDYIVKNTLGELLKNKKVDINKIRVLDPACGSGSFLIKAFDYLVDAVSEKNDISQTKLDTSGITATYSKKLDILTNNIFGVDLDKKAVEIAQLNLLLKIAEKGHRLPLLKENIKNGNSLIDDEKIAGEKAFVWKEQFKNIMEGGGFSVIIENPPYGSKKMLSEEEKSFIKKKHKFIGSNDTAEMFIEKSFNLLKKDGYFGFIVPKPLTYITSWNRIREFLATKDIRTIIDVSKAFEDVLLEQVIICVRNSPKTNNDVIIGDVENNQIKIVGKIKREYLNERIFQICNYGRDELLYKKIISCSDNLIDHFKIWAGIGGITPKLSHDKIGPLILKGKTISRYGFTKDVWYVPSSVPNENDIKEHNERRVVCQDIVAHITTPSPHIKLTATIVDKGVLTNETVINFSKKDDKLELETLLCILNLKLMSWFVYKFIFNNAIRTMHFRPGYADYAPIKIPSNQKPFVELCQKMIQLQKKLNDMGDKKTDERAKIEEEIKKTDAEIDELVYRIYGITEEEKKTIESSF